MSVRVIAVLVFLVALSAFAADFSVGCGQAYVYGPVTAKYVTHDTSTYTIGVNGRGYVVPEDFYYSVQVGDTVAYNGKVWTKVTPGQSPNIPPSLLGPTPSGQPTH
jgi:hypothetical protein